MFRKLLIISLWENWPARDVLVRIRRVPFRRYRDEKNGWYVIEILGFSFYWMTDK